MDVVRSGPARRRLVATIAAGAMAVMIAGFQAQGVGAASQQPPGCASFTVSDAQGALPGQAAGEVEVVPIPGAQVGTREGGAGPQGDAGQASQSGGVSAASAAPNVVSCVVDAAGVSGQVCVVSPAGSAGLAGPESGAPVESGTEEVQGQASPAGLQPGVWEHAAPGQTSGGSNLPSGGAGAQGNQALDPNQHAATAPGAAGAASTQHPQGMPATESGTSAGSRDTNPSVQPITGAGVEDIEVSVTTPGEYNLSCGAAGTGTGIGTGGAGTPIENETSTSSLSPAAGQTEQAPASGCEETVISQYPLPGGGSVNVSVTPC